MSAYELNEGLARASPKKGEPSRNPLGRSGRNWGLEIRRLLAGEGGQPCDYPGHEDKTKLQYLVWNLWELAMEGERWAATMILNRIYGRVPTTFEMQLDVHKTIEVEDLSNGEILARVERIREMMLSEVRDAECVTTSPEAEPKSEKG